MGFDLTMVEKPPAAELRKANLDATDPGYYRFNFAAMPVMVMTMVRAGAVSEGDVAPTWPRWSESIPEKRRELLEEAEYEPKLEAKLTVDERKSVVVLRKAHDVLRSTSGVGAKVPGYKFAGNDGYIVSPSECATIATLLRAYASKINAAEVAAVDKIYRERQKKLMDAIKKDGDITLMGDPDKGLGLSVPDYRDWVLDWAAYNDVASHHGGYRID